MRFIITQDERTFKTLSEKMPLFQVLNSHTEKPTWIFMNSIGLQFNQKGMEDLSFCLSDTLFF